jgi:hypothetical protein
MLRLYLVADEITSVEDEDFNEIGITVKGLKGYVRDKDEALRLKSGYGFQFTPVRFMLRKDFPLIPIRHRVKGKCAYPMMETRRLDGIGMADFDHEEY